MRAPVPRQKATARLCVRPSFAVETTDQDLGFTTDFEIIAHISVTEEMELIVKNEAGPKSDKIRFEQKSGESAQVSIVDRVSVWARRRDG